jgi:protease IV
MSSTRSFFSSFFGSCLGVIASIIILFLIVAGLGMSGQSGEKTYSKNSVLRLKLDSEIPEKTDNINSGTSSFMSGVSDNIGLYRITNLIKHASIDPKIEGIILENNSISLGQAGISTLMESLTEFKKSGKFIYSYADFHSQSSYFLCSIADSMFLNPQGGVDLRGFGTAIPFFKNMLDKLGVEFNVFYAGNFKSSTEPFRLKEMSEFNKIQTREFLNDMKDVMVESISNNRKIDTDKVENILREYKGRNAKGAIDNKLIDVLAYKDEFEAVVRQKLGLKIDGKIKYVSLSKYSHVVNLSENNSAENKIAIVYAEGDIIYGTDADGVISEKKYVNLLSKIRKDDKIKAVVLRVNSPGGNSFTSDVIWHELEMIKKTGKPLIASFGDYAASGGYYIAAGADKIFAQPNTLTGSIGVFMMMPDATKLLNEKVGVSFDTIKTHPFASGFSPVLKLSEAEKNILQESTLQIYDTFLDRVSKGRKLSLDSTKIIAQGRVWTGRMAKKLGLVDEIGNISDAILAAAKAAKLDEYRIVEYPFVEDDFFTSIVKSIQKSSQKNEDVKAMIATPEERKMLRYMEEWRAIIRCKEPNARLPLIFDFN